LHGHWAGAHIDDLAAVDEHTRVSGVSAASVKDKCIGKLEHARIIAVRWWLHPCRIHGRFSPLDTNETGYPSDTSCHEAQGLVISGSTVRVVLRELLRGLV